MADLNILGEIFDNNEAFQTLNELVNNIESIPEESLTQEAIEQLNKVVASYLTEDVKKTSCDALVQAFYQNGYNRQQAEDSMIMSKLAVDAYLNQLQLSESKMTIVRQIFNIFYEVFDKAIADFSKYDIVLNMTLEEGAHVPTYAHDSDAAADLYAMENITLPAHSISNMIKTGVHIQLPSHWMAMIVPRSSIGMKTGLRLSNSVGIIDEHYLGQLGVIYDNISDSDYIIHAGDRIAQMLIFPSYHFKPEIVKELIPTDRGEGGFGSSGV